MPKEVAEVQQAAAALRSGKAAARIIDAAISRRIALLVLLRMSHLLTGGGRGRGIPPAATIDRALP